MQYLPLLRTNIKSDAIVDLLEAYDLEVTYAFDRTRENLPDEYWSKCIELGLEFCFNANQNLQSMFIHLTGTDGFTPANLTDSDIIYFKSKHSAESFAIENGIATRTGGGRFLGEERDWIMLEFHGYSVHYEFRRGLLALVTITAT